jgi:type III secretion protein C
MKFWHKFIGISFLIAPVGLSPDLMEDGPLKEYDDDAFLSSTPKITSGTTGAIGWSLFRSVDEEDKYIINFNEVSIIEYLKFITRISKINFQFEEAELDFTITIAAEEPLTVQNILSTLIQTLRARGFTLLEQDNMLLITSSTSVNQLPKIVIGESDKDETAPIITRVFRIQNANLNSLATILRPMMSQAAMIEVSNETRQLIITDITTNVDKIAILLKSLDSPHTPLDIEMYRAKHTSAEQLAQLTKKIVEPFAAESPLILVAQNDANAVFIVSTPALIDRSMEVMEDLDMKPKEKTGPVGDQVYLYKLNNKTADELLDALDDVADELKDAGSTSLASTIESAKWIRESNSLLFITDNETQAKLETILKALDTPSQTNNYILFKVEKAEEKQLRESLDELAKSLKKGGADQDLVDAIHSMRYIKDSNSLIFTGSDQALKKLKELLPTFDTAEMGATPTSHFWLYTPQFLNGRELEDALQALQDKLASSGLSDPALLGAIESMRWVPATNTLLFTGSPAALEQIQSILKLIDVATGAPSKIFLYKPKYISNEQIEEALDELADKLDHKNLSDRNLAAAIDNMTWIRESQAFLFKADPASVDKITTFLKEIDNPKEAEAISSAYFLYKLKYARGNDVIDHLEKIAKSLPDRDPAQKAVINVIDNASYLKETNAVLLTGQQKAVEEVKLLISQFDVPGATPPSYEKTSFFIYKPRHLSAEQLAASLKETARDLKSSGLMDPSLLQSIDTMQVSELTGSVIFTGTKESLEKTKEIINTLDVSSAEKTGLDEFAGHTFYIYKVRYMSVEELLSLLDKVVKDIAQDTGEQNETLVKTMKGAKVIKETRSILFTGPPEILEKIAELLKQLDTPTGVGEAEVSEITPSDKVPLQKPLPGTYVIYKPVNISGPELIDMMHDFATNLQNSGVRDASLYSTIKNLQFIQKTGYILVSGQEKAVEQAQELLRKFDVQGNKAAVTSLTQMGTSFLVYKLQYHTGQEIQQTLKAISSDLSAADPNTGKNLLNAINSVQWVKITNSLLATGSPEVLTQLKELIQNLDVPLRQVFIEVLIIQTTITNNQQFGLQWGGKVQYLNRFAGGVSNFPVPSAGSNSNTAIAPALAAVNATRTPLSTDIPNPFATSDSTGASSIPGGFDLGVIGDIILHRGKTFISLASLVNALQSDNDSVVVMNPKIVAQDNQQATIFVGQNIPFTGSNVTTIQGGGQQIQSNIEYRDVGTNLTITPILGTNDIVTLDISNEITAQVENTTASSATLQGLQTSRTSLNVRVHVPDRHFVALSGMISDTKSHFKSGIPCLGGLPVIGAIFSENDRFNNRDNLIFFIRPVIIDSIEEYERITQNQECLYKELGVKQIVKEEIDDGIDWVKDREYECN